MGRSPSPARGKANGSRRGRHKRSRSPETQVWEREHLLPERPGWLDQDTYRRLAELRAEL